MNKPYKILFKYPSRGRIDRFFEGLSSIYSNLQDTENFHVACTLDVDDTVMNCNDFKEQIAKYDNLSIQWGASESKIHAVNRDIPDVDWDVIVVMSDDMRFTFFGFDQLIRQDMPEDLDCLLHYPDQDAKDMLATMFIAGRTFVKRFRYPDNPSKFYLYDPRCKSLWCDNLVQAIAQRLGKYKFVNCPGVISHLCPAYGHIQRDEMFDRQQLDWPDDEAIFRKEEAENFNIHLYQ